MARDDFEFTIDKGEWEQVIALTKELPPIVGQQAFGKSVDEGTKDLLETMRGNINDRAQDPTGMLSRSLVTRRKRKYEPSFWHGSVAVNVGKKRGDGAFYWNIVERGHRVVTPSKIDTGKKVAAMRYAISAFETNKRSITSNFATKTKAILMKHWKKIGR